MKLSPATAMIALLPVPRIKQKTLALPPPEEPCLGPTGARFFAWLLKIGEHESKNKLSICKVEWERTKRICGILSTRDRKYEFEKYMRCIGKNIVFKTIDHGEEVVKLTRDGRDWAERWIIWCRTYRGHHGDMIIFED